MKILVPGRPQTGWATERVCDANGGCGARLRVEQDDLFVVKYDGMSIVSYRCAGCGVCNVAGNGSYESPPSLETWEKVRRIAESKLISDFYNK